MKMIAFPAAVMAVALGGPAQIIDRRRFGRHEIAAIFGVSVAAIRPSSTLNSNV